MIRAHYNGMKALAERDPNLAGMISPSHREVKGELVHENYVILYPASPASLDDQRLTKKQSADSNAEFFQDAKVVAVDALGCADIVSALIAQFVGSTPVVSGRKCWPIQLDSSGDVEWQTVGTKPLFFCDLTFAFKSDRA